MPQMQNDTCRTLAAGLSVKAGDRLILWAELWGAIKAVRTATTVLGSHLWDGPLSEKKRTRRKQWVKRRCLKKKKTKTMN